MYCISTDLPGICGAMAPLPAADTPYTIPSGNEFWLEADKNRVDSPDGVEEIGDQGDSGNDLTQTTGTYRPGVSDNQFGSLPGIVFDAVDDYMELDTQVDVAPGLSFWLAVIAGSNDYVCGDWTTDHYRVDTVNRWIHRAGSGSNSILSASSSVVYGEADLWEIHADDSGDYSIARITRDSEGDPVVTDVSYSPISNRTANFKLDTFNSFASWGTKAGITLGAAVLFDHELSASDKTSVRGQLARWARAA